MLKYFFRRLLWVIPVFLAVTLMTCLFMRLLPGNPFSDTGISPEAQARMLAAYGLDRPWYDQYFVYVTNFIQGNWGYSFQQMGRPVSTIIGEHIGYSITLAVIAVLATMLTGIPLGIISALNHNKFFDYLATGFSLFLYSIPGFVLAILALLLILLINTTFGFSLSLTRAEPGLGDLILPGIILGIRPAAIIARLTRSRMLEVLRQDYIRVAKAKGLNFKMVVIRHALKNSLIPIVTVLGDELGALAVGSVTIEAVFAIPGTGAFLVNSIQARDYPLILTITALYALIVVIINLLVDILYGFLDPRIRFSSERRFN
jgi:oligopeptide transport system permease protein